MSFPLVACPKPTKRRAVVKAEARHQQTLTRRQIIHRVWLRDKGRCVRCGKTCKRPVETYPTDPDRGEVNDMLPRSRGGDPLSMANNELLCVACHRGGKSGAHAPTKARMVVQADGRETRDTRTREPV